ncbi:putative peptidoglycan binding domain protein [Mycobacterium kansasii]|uniref:Putative peptidoglycan binding domain protein n=1 Tax=Mycobacterium kansasii TaxID=1768 RepID=A0A1V3XTR4_MYCKA|nr:putative peptidoglycan binding domain protein [Mycobacterium kansasii]
MTQDVITALRAHALTRKLGTKTQTSKLQKTMLRAARARNIDLHIDGTEMRTKELGPSTQAAIRTLQARFGLPATGTMDPETFDRVHAAAASKPRKPVLVSAPDPTALKPIPRALRLNATNKDVPVLQRTLAFLGHAVNETEFKDTRFGASTRAAVLAFQKSAGCRRPVTSTGARSPRSTRPSSAPIPPPQPPRPASAEPSATPRGPASKARASSCAPAPSVAPASCWGSAPPWPTVSSICRTPRPSTPPPASRYPRCC